MPQERDQRKLTLPVSPRDWMQGSLLAAVTLVQYGDYQCAHSRQAYLTVKEQLARLGNRLCFVFRHFPVSQIHPQAQHAAEAALAAGAQNKFWEMHEMLFARQRALENGSLVEYADNLGLDTTQFLRDMGQHTFAGHVQEDFMSGMQSGVSYTPTFFINGVRHDDLWNTESLLAAVEKAALT